jgi:tRNA1(Val) A37 N6-methylase TrmN6
VQISMTIDTFVLAKCSHTVHSPAIMDVCAGEALLSSSSFLLGESLVLTVV